MGGTYCSTAVRPRPRHIQVIGACLTTTAAVALTCGSAASAVTIHSSHSHIRPLTLPNVHVPRRGVITFTVPVKTPPAPALPELPRSVGDYFAAYLPELRQGWVNMRDPGSPQGWPAQFPLIGSERFPDLMPHHRYRMLVAVQRPGKVSMPFPMHVISVQRMSFRVVATTRRLLRVVPATPLAIGSTVDPLGGLPVTSTGVVIDWANEVSPVDFTYGDACPNASALGALHCPAGNLSTFVITTQGIGGSVSPLQVVIGEGFDHPVSARYISGYADNLPTPFNAATIVGFGIDPPPSPK
jgi:hypothetical protein